jgi:hypothetical protein
MALAPSGWSIAFAAGFLVDLLYESTRRAQFDGEALAFRAFHLRWRTIPVREIDQIEANRSLRGFFRELTISTKQLGFHFTPLLWAGTDEFIVAVVDRCLEIDPNVKINGGARREIANARGASVSETRHRKGTLALRERAPDN